MLSNLLETVIQTGFIGFFLGVFIVFFGIAILVFFVWAIGKILKNSEGLTASEFIARNMKKITAALACIVLVVAIILAIVEGKSNTCPARNTFWMFAGVMCLGEGLVFYLHSIKSGDRSLLLMPSIIITGLGALWLVTDIIINGSINGAGSGWWVGLITAVIVAILMYLLTLKGKNVAQKEKKHARKEKVEEPAVVVVPQNEEIPEHIKVAIMAAIYAYYEQQNERCEFIVRKIKRRS